MSVRVLTHDYGRFLGTCLQSVLDQTFEDLEVIVIDDASTDDSWAIAQDFASRDPRIRAVRHDTNRGFMGSLLHSAELARGEYHVQLDADDWLLSPDVLTTLVELMDGHPTMAFCFSPYALHDESGSFFYCAEGLGADVVLGGELAIGEVMKFVVPHSGTVVRRSSYDAVGGYDPAYPYGPDMRLFYSLCAVGDVGYVHRPLIGYRVHGSNMSTSARWSLIFDESVRAVESVFASPFAERIPDAHRVRRAALRSFLQQHPSKEIFAGHYRSGWRLLMRHARRQPWLSLVQPNTLVLVARTVLGGRLYARLRGAAP